MALTQKQVYKKYNRFARFYDFLEMPIEKGYFSKWRKSILKNVQGKVLEIGVGTGKNLPYYNYNKVNLTAIDISAGMLERARNKIKKNNLPVKLKLIKTEKLPFKDNYFDFIIMTFVLCSVADPMITLSEMKRVLKKNGRIILLEHLLSKNKLIAFWEHLHNPLTKHLFGFNVNRDTMKNIKKAGLKIVKEKNLAFYDVFKEIEVRK